MEMRDRGDTGEGEQRNTLHSTLRILNRIQKNSNPANPESSIQRRQHSKLQNVPKQQRFELKQHSASNQSCSWGLFSSLVDVSSHLIDFATLWNGRKLLKKAIISSQSPKPWFENTCFHNNTHKHSVYKTAQCTNKMYKYSNLKGGTRKYLETFSLQCRRLQCWHLSARTDIS